MAAKPGESATPTLTSATAAVIRALMGEHGITQEQIADALGRSQGYVSPRVVGKSAFDTDEIDRIATLAGLNGVQLLQEAARKLDQQRRVGGSPDDAGNVTPITRRPVGELTVDELEALPSAATHDASDPQEYPEG